MRRFVISRYTAVDRTTEGGANTSRTSYLIAVVAARAGSLADVERLGVAVDGDCLAADHARRVRGEEQAQVGDLGRLHEAGDRLSLEVLALDLQGRCPAGVRLPGDDVSHAVAVHGAWADRVGAHAVPTELDGERLGQADHRPLGG